MGCCKSKDALLGQSKAELEACRGLLTEFNSTPEAADIKMASEDMINAINNLLLGPDDQVARLVEDAQACLTELRAVLPKLPEGVEIDKGKANDEFAKRLEVAIGGYQTAITEKLTTPGEGAEGEASVGSKENKHWVETSEEMQHLRKMREEIGRNGGFLDAITASLNEEGSSGGAWFQQGQAEAKKVGGRAGSDATAARYTDEV